MSVYAAMTTIAGREPAEDLAADLEELEIEPYAVGVTEIEDGSGLYEVGAHFMTPPDEIQLMLLSAVYGAKGFLVSEVPDIDWVAKVKRELAPVVAGRFFVHGGHDTDKIPAGSEPLLIEAAMAFGTGHHGTTLGCLRALDRMIERGEVRHKVADIGAGTAVLAMAAARVWPGTVIASDIDPVAVETAAANVKANNLEGRVICVEAPGFDSPALADAAPFDLIFANILKGPLIALSADMAKATQAGGQVILSGLLVEQAEEIIGVYKQNGFNLAEREDIGEWSALVMTKV